MTDAFTLTLLSFVLRGTESATTRIRPAEFKPVSPSPPVTPAAARKFLKCFLNLDACSVMEQKDEAGQQVDSPCGIQTQPGQAGLCE